MLRSISQKESLEWQSRGAFRALAVSAAANLSHKLRHLRRISATQHKVLTFAAACLSQKLSLLCLIKMFVSHLAVSQHDTDLWVRLCGGSTRPPPLAACCRSSMTLGSRGLCTPGVSRVVGREGKPARNFHFPQI